MSIELLPLHPDGFEEWLVGWSAWYAHDLEEHGGLDASAAREKPSRDIDRGLDGSLGFVESFVSMGKDL